MLVVTSTSWVFNLGIKAEDGEFSGIDARHSKAPVAPRGARPGATLAIQPMRWGATTLRNSREVMILVFFQNLGKWRWLPVTR